jgi:hypothetical protein
LRWRDARIRLMWRVIRRRLRHRPITRLGSTVSMMDMRLRVATLRMGARRILKRIQSSAIRRCHRQRGRIIGRASARGITRRCIRFRRRRGKNEVTERSKGSPTRMISSGGPLLGLGYTSVRSKCRSFGSAYAIVNSRWGPKPIQDDTALRCVVSGVLFYCPAHARPSVALPVLMRRASFHVERSMTAT